MNDFLKKIADKERLAEMTRQEREMMTPQPSNTSAPTMSQLDFLKQLTSGNIYDYSKSPQENENAGMALSANVTTPDLVAPQSVQQKEQQLNLPQIPLRNDFQPVVENSVPPEVAQKAIPVTKNNIPAMPPKEMPAAPEEVKPEVAPEKSLSERLNELLGQNKNFEDTELRDAQNARSQRLKDLAMLDAANMMAQGIYGGKADPNLLNRYRDLAGLGVSDVQDRRKASKDLEDRERTRRKDVMDEMTTESDLKYKDLNQKKIAMEIGDKEKENDPNSEVSKAFRSYLKSYVDMAGVPIKIDDKMSMSSLQKTTGMVGNLVTAKMAQDARRDALIEKRESKIEQKTKDENQRALESFNKYKPVTQLTETMSKAENALALVEAAPTSPAAWQALGTQAARALGEVGNLTEADIGRFQGSPAWARKVQRWYSLGAKGTPPMGDLKDVQSLLETFKRKNEEAKVKLAGDFAKQYGKAYKRDANEILEVLDPDRALRQEQNKQQSKSVVKKEYSPSRNQTRITYNDGTTEIVDGKK